VTKPASSKVAIVTGASQGIGAGLVAGFRRAGYRVVGTARTINPSNDPDFLAVAGDITVQETAEQVVAQALSRFGRIDSLVNNAGIFIGKPFTEYTIEDYSAVTAVNLAGFFHITQRVLRQMVIQGGGHIVNMSASLVNNASSTRPAVLASLTKGGLDAATRGLALEYASRGIRVNAIAPGVIRTPAHELATYDGLAALHPLGRLGEVDDIVDAILYLEQATFVTGVTLPVDGGQSAGQ
jgi:NAD(P)-dependent dehydrogenase (short-subunit alcohol dehydrogenase family)